MTRRSTAYPTEFRQQMIELVRAGRNPEELAREFEPTAQTIRNWVAQAERDEGRRTDGLSTVERQELTRRRRENRQLTRRHFENQSAARMAIFEFIEGWYNPHRRHSGNRRFEPQTVDRPRNGGTPLCARSRNTGESNVMDPVMSGLFHWSRWRSFSPCSRVAHPVTSGNITLQIAPTNPIAARIAMTPATGMTAVSAPTLPASNSTMPITVLLTET
ncbi:hypothetical protein B1C78_14630 [Thioalkalivibrio denitrificans]|uniref:Transposase n=1 Tax=Thioalkalivibrio denitrificans TaxID=108003 RepID=A0A1V3NC91_9GAMM|nr:hypothetical protein B1C78_14630 [Thioalkalivibrio denitrificans]